MIKEYKEIHRLNENARGINILCRGSGSKHCQSMTRCGTNGGIYYGYQLLATQIIKRACDDYILQSVKITRNTGVKREKLLELITFFNGELFTAITGLDGADFVKILDKKIEKSLQNNKPML